MTTYTTEGDAIECSKSHINTRKVSYSALIKIGVAGVRLHKYKTNIRTSVEIIEELIPKEPIIDPRSALNLNDVVEAQVVEIYLKKKVDFGKVSNYTSTHSAYSCTANCFTYAKIAIPWRIFANAQNLIPNQQRFLL